MEAKYDVALSFAGEDRAYVKQVAAILQKSGIHVFYDEFEEANLWGKNLYTYLRQVYRDQARYTIIFCSTSYAAKVWTNHERESAQERALGESCEYILPARFDDSVIPGLPSTVAYVDLRKKSPHDLCLLIGQKLNATIAEVSEEFLAQNAPSKHHSNVGPAGNNNAGASDPEDYGCVLPVQHVPYAKTPRHPERPGTQCYQTNNGGNRLRSERARDRVQEVR